MARKAIPISLKARKASEERDLLMAQAIAFYQAEQIKVLGPKERRKGLRTICKDVEIAHRRDTGKTITLNHSTLRNLANGGRSLTDFNASKSWLSLEEDKVVLDYVIEVARRGFPVTHRRLKECVDLICRARLGDRFPVGGVGQNWTHRFMERHHDVLSTYRARPLDTKRGKAVNSTVNTDWFTLLGNTLQHGDDGNSIAPECIWGTDETGFQPNGGPTEIVIGPARQRTQYQQRDGNRETITVIVTICGNGTSIAPAVLYKGQVFQSKWKQDNPVNAILGYSKKGWTNGEISVEWMKHFDKQTRVLADGRYRLLLVDGHNSHYSRGFLEYARDHRIHVLCYPSHATHVYQGLDVAVFSVLKRCWGEERDTYERETGEQISKENFLTVYGRAHLRALHQEVIIAAFRKTGVIPFNPAAINEIDLAPSRETQWNHDSVTPVALSTPVKVVSNLLSNLTMMTDGTHTFLTTIKENEDDYSQPPSPTLFTPETPVRTALERLGSSNVRFLVSESPLKASSQVPIMPLIEFSPTKPRNDRTCSIIPSTVTEEALQNALVISEKRENYWKDRCRTLQSQSVLLSMHNKKMCRQLAQKEARRNKPKGLRLKLHDGRGRLLTDEEFIEEIALNEEEREAGEREKEKRKSDKESRAVQLAGEIEEWERKEQGRKKRNEALLSEWEADVKQWEEERDEARKEKRRPAWKKPVKPKLERAEAKPKSGRTKQLSGDTDEGFEDEAISVGAAGNDEADWETDSSFEESD